MSEVSSQSVQNTNWIDAALSTSVRLAEYKQAGVSFDTGTRRSSTRPAIPHANASEVAIFVG